MSIEVSESLRESVLILELKGRITAGESGAIREKVDQAIVSGHLNVVFDLTHVEYVDSTGLGGMVICYTTLKRHGGALKLVNPNKRNVELLALTRLHTVFEVFNEPQDAVNSFFPGREIKRFDILAFVKEHEQDEE